MDWHRLCTHRWCVTIRWKGAQTLTLVGKLRGFLAGRSLSGWIPWTGGRRTVLKIVLLVVVLHLLWDMIISDRIPIPKSISDIINILISGVIVYLLVVSRAGEILFPEGAIGKDGSDSVSPVVDDPGHTSPVVLVDDDQRFLSSAKANLRTEGFRAVHTIGDSRELLAFLSDKDASVIVLNLDMPHIRGMELLQKIKQDHPHLPVIVIAGAMEVETAAACIKAGAFDFLIKPVEKNRFLSSIRRAAELRDLRNHVSTLHERLLSGPTDEELAYFGIVTEDPKMRLILQYAKAVARTGQPVLITGETGVGKELMAQAVHKLSACKGEFVAVNLAGLEDQMLSDALFGHRKGAFTGAEQSREGLLARAVGGTMFLDEIGDLAEASQVKLLRLLEEKEYYPLGSDTPRKTDARIICATHRNLRVDVAAGKFRNDLYYRLSAHQVHIPPLRERMEDLQPLVHHFLEESAQSMQRKKPTPPPELFTLLSAYCFPGNIRELRAMVQNAMTRHKSGILSLESFKQAIGENAPAFSAASHAQEQQNGNGLFSHIERIPTLKEAEGMLVAEALKRSRNNQGIAAQLLGISRHTLNKRLSREKQSTKSIM
jgi:DNA-binding NtrC family response regulator